MSNGPDKGDEGLLRPSPQNSSSQSSPRLDPPSAIVTQASASESSASLLRLQQQFQAALLEPRRFSEDAAKLVQDSNRLSAAQHLSIYQRSYIARLRQCMATQFSALNYALGESLFQMFVSEYLQQHPSNSYTLNVLGQRFSDFLQRSRDAFLPPEETWPAFIIELAHFEYALSVLFDSTQVDQTKAALDTPDDELMLAPVHQLFHHHFPLAQYYRHYKNGEQPELPLPLQSHALVVRHQYRIGVFELSAQQFQLLSLLQQTGTVGHNVHMAQQKMTYLADFASFWAKCRHRWILSGVLVYKC